MSRLRHFGSNFVRAVRNDRIEAKNVAARLRDFVESRTSAGTDAETSPRFSSPLIKPDVPVSSIRLSDGLHRK
ncbi:MAG: hypothetical protein ABR881_24190, partial [Candidatus Sulfotelmatobacter sp.]